MKRMNLRLNAAALIGGTIVAASALADTQQGGSGYGMGSGSGMMGGNGSGWMGSYGSGSMGGYGIWLPILLVAVIAGLVVWIVAKKKK